MAEKSKGHIAANLVSSAAESRVRVTSLSLACMDRAHMGLAPVDSARAT